MQITIEKPTVFCELTGYTCITTYYEDLSIAENFGISSIKETLQRAAEHAKVDYQMLTELVMMVNWKSWRWADENPKLSQFYAKEYYRLYEYALNNLNRDEIDYFCRTLD